MVIPETDQGTHSARFPALDDLEVSVPTRHLPSVQGSEDAGSSFGVSWSHHTKCYILTPV